MTALAIVVAGADPDRARTALTIAAAAAALGRDVAMLFDGASVATLPDLGEPLATALGLGVRITACATGLADRGIVPPDGLDSGGMVGFLSVNAAAHLLAV